MKKRMWITVGSIMLIVILTTTLFISVVEATNTSDKIQNILIKINENYSYKNLLNYINNLKKIFDPGELLNLIAQLIVAILVFIFMHLPL